MESRAVPEDADCQREGRASGQVVSRQVVWKVLSDEGTFEQGSLRERESHLNGVGGNFVQRVQKGIVCLAR